MNIIKEGDRVKHIYKGYTGIVDSVYGDFTAYVRFDDPNVLPCRLPISEYEVIEASATINDACPKCGSEWKETYISHEPKYDCIKCNIRKEDCVNELRGSV